MPAVATGRKTVRGGGKQPPRWWWGTGAAPLELWPGTTLDLQVVWSSARGRWESPDGRYFFDDDAATRAADFFPDILRHHIGEFAGRPFTLMEYQVKLLTRPLFGWKRQSDGTRRFRRLFAFLPKGAGKSPWAAGTGVYLARCDGEAAAEVYAVANDRGQARTVHDNAKVLVEDAPLLADGADILKDSIYWSATRSAYIVLSSDASSAHGKRPHGLILDELHGFSGDRDRELFEALTQSLKKRRQPMLMMITHSGTDDEGICHQEYDYAKAVLSGTIPDETHLPVIFELQKGDDWKSPAVHAKVNPGYGITVKADAVEADCLAAIGDPRKQNDFKRWNLNAWTNQSTAWIPVEWWDACYDAAMDDAELVGLECAAGLDLAQKWDLASFVVAFKRPLEKPLDVKVTETNEDGKEPVEKSISLNYELFVRSYFWIPEATLQQHEEEDKVPYSYWRDLEHVTATDGSVIDYDRIYTDITQTIVPRYPLLKQGIVGYDPAFATDIATKLRDKGHLKISEIPQNYVMLCEPSQIVEALIKGKRIHQDGNKVYRWNWENVEIKTDEATRRIRPVKPRTHKRVDGVLATVMAQKALSLNTKPAPTYQVLFLGGSKR